jgi:hypothetical protein
LPRESSIYPEPPLLHLRMLPHLQMAPVQHAIETRAAGDAMKGTNPAAVVERPTEITFTRSDRYLDTVPERIICILPYLSDQCGLLDRGTLNREMGLANWQMGLIDKRCRTDS